MPNTSSAKKALRVSRRRREINLKRKRLLKSTVKTFKKLVKEGNREEAEKMLSKVYEVADKIAKTGYIKKNKAARIKSRMTKLFSKTFMANKKESVSPTSTEVGTE